MSKFEDTFLQMKPRYPEETIISNPPLIGSIRPIYQPPQKGQEKKNINQQLLLNGFDLVKQALNVYLQILMLR